MDIFGLDSQGRIVVHCDVLQLVPPTEACEHTAAVF
jgi:hypothetical protein